MSQLSRKVVIVTGSSIGIGAATIKEFAKNGFNVVINYLHNKEKAYALKEEVESKYNIEAMVIQADVSKEEDVINLVNEVQNKFKRIDCLVNNAGIAIDTTLEDKKVSDFQKILNTNVIGVFLMSKYVGKIMLNQKEGSIVNISSTNGIDTYYSYSMDYDASKAGVISLTHNFANLYAPIIKVNCIAPGWVSTDMNKELDEEYIKNECKNILLGRFALPEEIAKNIFYIAMDAPYINDTIIRVDGGVKRC